MGWISDRCHKTGTSIGGNPAKTRETNRYPLRKIVAGGISTNIFEPAWVTFECGHTGYCWGASKGRCKKCPPRAEGKEEMNKSMTAKVAAREIDLEQGVPNADDTNAIGELYKKAIRSQDYVVEALCQMAFGLKVLGDDAKNAIAATEWANATREEAHAEVMRRVRALH